ncbi:MAG: hypothetical protein ACMUIP_05410 [bacterium]
MKYFKIRIDNVAFFSILILCLLANLSFAQTNWIKYAENPVIQEGDDEVVIKDGDVYKMWYQQDDEICYATSSDGINWTEYSGNPVLKTGPSGSWDEEEVDGPSVVLEAGTYKMWYKGSTSFIGYAHSSDGITWIKHDDNPLFEGAGPISAKLFLLTLE